jgi:hypothetical protein
VGNVYLGGMPVMFCPEENTAPDIVVLRTDTSTPPAGVALRVINGITTSRLGPRGGSLLIASRHVSITATGPSAGRVLNTVTYSPRAVALARTTAPDLPKSWHRVSFGGLSAAVPRAWPVERRTDWPLSCASIALRLADTEVLLSAGVREVAPSCPALASGRLAIAPPVDGVVIDPGPDGPVADGATFGPCLHVHGLRACPATVDPSGVLVLSVHRPGRTHALAVEVGLAGSGATARAIVDSLRAA